MKALILAYDKAKDLKPLTTTLPKAMLPVLNKPVIEYNIEKLRDAGFSEIGIVIGYLGHKIREYFLNGYPWNVKIHYLPMQNTWHATLAPFADERLLIVEGEWLSDADPAKAAHIHDGNLLSGENGCGGIYVVKNGFFKDIFTDASVRDLILEQPHSVVDEKVTARRIENVADYLKVNLQNGILTGKESQVDASVYLNGSVVIGNHVTVEQGCIIKNSVILDHTHICADCEIENAVIGKNVLIKNGTFVFDHSMIGQGAKIGKNVFVKADSRIPPFKVIPDQANVGENETPATLNAVSIWNGEISGSVFSEMTPEFAVKTGKSMVYLAGTQKKIGIAWDGDTLSYPLYIACLSGLVGSGGNVLDAGKQKYPVFHTLAVRNAIDLGVYIASGSGECTFCFIDKNGDILSSHKQKQLEMIINRNEGEALSGIHYKLETIKIDYFEMLKELAIPANYTIQIKCKDGFARQALCMYRQTMQNPDICFCLNTRMDKMCIEGLQEREMYVLYSIVLLEEYHEKLKVDGEMQRIVNRITQHVQRKKEAIAATPFSNLLKGDGILACVLVLNYMTKNNLTKEKLIEKIPRFFTLSTEIQVENKKRERIVQKITNGQSQGKVKIAKDGGWVMIIPHGRKNAFQVVSEGYNKEYAQDLLEYYVNLIKETEEEL